MKNLIGNRYNKLLVVEYLGAGKNGSMWKCQCDCGCSVNTFTYLITTGRIYCCKSCRKANKNHFLKNKYEYICWVNMKQRCYNKTLKQYKDYGGRGVIVCEEWVNSFESFYKDMGNRPSKHHSLDRYPNKDGNYSKENCRWATIKQQANNKRNNAIYEINGDKRTISQWACFLGVDRMRIQDRLKNGFSFESVYNFLIEKKKPYSKIRNECNTEGIVAYCTFSKMDKDCILKNDGVLGFTIGVTGDILYDNFKLSSSKNKYIIRKPNNHLIYMPIDKMVTVWSVPPYRNKKLNK